MLIPSLLKKPPKLQFLCNCRISELLAWAEKCWDNTVLIQDIFKVFLSEKKEDSLKTLLKRLYLKHPQLQDLKAVVSSSVVSSQYKTGRQRKIEKEWTQTTYNIHELFAKAVVDKIPQKHYNFFCIITGRNLSYQIVSRPQKSPDIVLWARTQGKNYFVMNNVNCIYISQW